MSTPTQITITISGPANCGKSFILAAIASKLHELRLDVTIDQNTLDDMNQAAWDRRDQEYQQALSTLRPSIHMKETQTPRITRRSEPVASEE